MLVYLSGTVRHQGVGYVVVENQGIGYKVSFPENIVVQMKDQVEIHVHEAMRDNERELFGFASIEQLELFWKLIGVSGVGPRSGQRIVFAKAVDQVKSSIMAGDLSSLTSVSGIGKKTAQKIILELKGALAEEPNAAALDGDAVDALMGLGYTKRDAEAALSGIEASTTEERIRIALKGMAK